MNTWHKPRHDELPDSGRLVRSTIAAAVVAAVLLVTTVLPSEYGIDPTGIGSLLGLSDMGKIKVQLAEEADREERRPAAGNDSASAEDRLQRIEAKLDRIAATLSFTPVEASVKRQASKPQPVESKPDVVKSVENIWKDEFSINLAPGQGVEIKLVMEKGNTAWFEWTANGSKLNFDTHGDGAGQSIRYKKGRGIPRDAGVLKAAFTGNHGWFWRNRTATDVTLTLKTRGNYSKLKRTA